MAINNNDDDDNNNCRKNFNSFLSNYDDNHNSILKSIFSSLPMCILQATLQPDLLPVITKRHLVKVTGAADRHRLTKEILDFCGVFPIYNIKQFEINETRTDG